VFPGVWGKRTELKHALVIHPILSFYAGGEYLCLNVCKTLQEMGYCVSLACDLFNPSDVERIYGLGEVMEKCDYVPIPQFRPAHRLLFALQRLGYAWRVLRMFSRTNADIVFSTQSSPFVIPQRVFHFVYSVNDLFQFPQKAAALEMNPTRRVRRTGPRELFVDGLKKPAREVVKRYAKLIWRKPPKSKDWFFAIGSIVLEDIRQKGYLNSSLAFPPCRVDFNPKFPKKKQVVQAARMIPDKRLELYFEIASLLPEYKFLLIGRDSQMSRRSYPGYADGLLSRLPSNVVYVDALVRERPELLEESKVYLYTGIEKGIGLALVEAVAAGCVPFCPTHVGATDVVRALGVGDVYETAEQAASILRETLEEESDENEVFRIRQRALRFSPEAFGRWIKGVVESSGSTAIGERGRSLVSCS
jgi:glycosyltransferase involved in cell wall biosynthesis